MSSQSPYNDFEVEYKKCISAIMNYNEDASKLSNDSLFYVLSYLSYFSGHQTQMYIGDVNGYLKKSQYREDISIWKHWIKRNGAKYSLARADSLFVNYMNFDTMIHSKIDVYPVLITPDAEYDFKSINDFIKLNLEYPENEADCAGSVLILLVIGKDGSVENKEFYRRLCPGFDENAMAVVNLMKEWQPGIRNGLPIRTRLIIPISFDLK